MRLLIFALLFFTLTASAQNPLSYNDFAQLPDASRLTLSPDGKTLAAVVRVALPDQQGVAVQVTKLSSGEREFMLFTDNSQYFIDWLRWKDERTLLVGSFYPSQRDSRIGWSQVRYNTREGRLLIIDTHTGEVTTPFSTAFLRRFTLLPSGLNHVIDTLPDDPEHILMALPNQTGTGPSNVIYRVNIRNQSARIVQRPENRIVGWATDRQHNIRVALHARDDIVTLRIKDAKTNRWRDLWSYEIFSDDEITPMGFGYDPNILYITAYHNDLKALYSVDLSEPELTKTLVHADPNFDVGGGLIYDRKGQRVLGIGGSYDGGTLFFDNEFKALQTRIDTALPHTRNFVYSLTDDLNQFLVYSTGHQESGTYYLGTREPLALNAVAYSYNALEPAHLSPVQEFPYKTRDGLDVQAWLTRPANTDADVKLPTLMFPHGGPHSRDAGAFDYWTQYFASKGYAVLQMNFRGSTGQGYSFFRAGLQNWGREMQDDIEDGARALIKAGIADPEKVCIVGASYGGYAALMGIVKTPDFYQCAISVNGVSDVFELVRSNRQFWSTYNVVEAQIGRFGRELREISPVNFAEQIKAPVLLIHGDSDRQVEPAHSQRMHAALQRAGKDVIYIELPAEDHYLSNEINRMATFKAMDEFLDRHLAR